MKYKILLLFIFGILIAGCGAKRAFYEPYAMKPDTLAPKLEKKEVGNQKYQENKARKKIIDKQWKLYEKLRDSLSKNNFSKFDALLKNIADYQEKNRDTLLYEEYYYGSIYYSGYRKLKEYYFEDAESIFKTIPETSIFYRLAQLRIKRINSDSDGDGYNDEWELLEGYNPMNPYSHP